MKTGVGRPGTRCFPTHKGGGGGHQQHLPGCLCFIKGAGPQVRIQRKKAETFSEKITVEEILVRKGHLVSKSFTANRPTSVLIALSRNISSRTAGPGELFSSDL